MSLAEACYDANNGTLTRNFSVLLPGEHNNLTFDVLNASANHTDEDSSDNLFFTSFSTSSNILTDGAERDLNVLSGGNAMPTDAIPMLTSLFRSLA